MYLMSFKLKKEIAFVEINYLEVELMTLNVATHVRIAWKFAEVQVHLVYTKIIVLELIYLLYIKIL